MTSGKKLTSATRPSRRRVLPSSMKNQYGPYGPIHAILNRDDSHTLCGLAVEKVSRSWDSFKKYENVTCETCKEQLKTTKEYSMSFQREDRYLVLKRSDIDRALTLPMQTTLWELVELIRTNRKVYGKRPLKCVVVECDWPEYEQVWEEIQRRMEGRPTILDEELGRWQDKIFALCCNLAPEANIDGGGCDSGDPLDLATAEIEQAFNHWDNLLFDTMESVSHSYVDTPTLKAAADFILQLAKENEDLTQKSCDECDPENYGWVFNRVEGRGACTCMLEAEPFQILQAALERIASGDHGGSFFRVEEIAKEALKTVLPLDYADKMEVQ